MHLSPKEIDKLMLHNAGFLAQKRYARRLKLNYPEAMALLAAQLQEFVREGEPVAELMNKGKSILGYKDVMEGVPGMLTEVQIEGTFPDGTKLVTVHEPICREHGSEELALYGSGLKREAEEKPVDNVIQSAPGKVYTRQEDIVLNENRNTVEVHVVNMGDRPVQVGSHYPFFEANARLQFDRAKAFGFRLNIPAGTAVRFEPGESKTVQLVEIAGEQKIYGGNALTMGLVNEQAKKQAMHNAQEQNFMNKPEN